jgi:predicted methyltransferase
MKTVILVGVAAVAFTAFAAQSATMAKADVAAAIADPSRPEKDRALDASRKPAEILAAIGIRRGQTVADVWPGAYWDRLFADAVGPKGRVYAVHLSEADQVEHVETPAAGSAPYPEHPNVTVVVTTANTLTLPTKADVIWIRQNYHDLYDKFMGPADVPAFDKAVYRSLKPGGLFVVVDHSAPDGSGIASTDTTHRIDAARVKSDMATAGFVFVKESNALRNPADDRTKKVFDPSIRGQTDQFVYIFRRP